MISSEVQSRERIVGRTIAALTRWEVLCQMGVLIEDRPAKEMNRRNEGGESARRFELAGFLEGD